MKSLCLAVCMFLLTVTYVAEARSGTVITPIRSETLETKLLVSDGDTPVTIVFRLIQGVTEEKRTKIEVALKEIEGVVSVKPSTASFKVTLSEHLVSQKEFITSKAMRVFEEILQRTIVLEKLKL